MATGPAARSIDALLLFGALNWIARWYDARRALDIDALAAECIRFFLRVPAPAPRKSKARTRRPGAPA